MKADLMHQMSEDKRMHVPRLFCTQLETKEA